MPKYPYATTMPGLTATVTQLRSNFPQKLTAETMKKYGIAANNESSILATLRFVGLIDNEGTKNAEAGKAFVLHDDKQFGEAFGAFVKKAYEGLFELHPDAWKIDRSKLISYFRTSDQTSARVGEQQAATFSALAALAGHGPVPSTTNGATVKPPRAAAPRASGAQRSKPAAAAPSPAVVGQLGNQGGAASGLNISLRIELNLPVSEKQEVYDNIFRSIRENLINV